MNDNAGIAEEQAAVVGPGAEFASRPPRRPITKVKYS